MALQQPTVREGWFSFCTHQFPLASLAAFVTLALLMLICESGTWQMSHCQSRLIKYLMKPIFSQTQPVLHQIKLCNPVRECNVSMFWSYFTAYCNLIDVSENDAPVVFWRRHKFSYTETCDDTKYKIFFLSNINALVGQYLMALKLNICSWDKACWNSSLGHKQQSLPL